MSKLLKINKLILILCLGWAPLSYGQEKEAKAEDVETINGLMKALYETISGDAGVERQWDRMRTLFAPDARLIPTNENEDGTNGYNAFSLEQFIEVAKPGFKDQGFFEYETSRREQHYGRIVHIMSTYASKRSMDDKKAFNSGVNSLQLFNDGKRWWIMNLYWAHASEKNPITHAFQPNPPVPDPEDVSSISSIIKALYASISGPKGQERQWDRFRSLFVQDAKLIPSGKNQEGKFNHNFIGIDQYISWVGDYFKENGFFEEEIHADVQEFGSVAHVFSTYTSKREKDGEVFARGINSIQLMHDGARWWIVNVYWTAETPKNPIPEAYLPK